MRIRLLFFILLYTVVMGCGEGNVSITDSAYNAKIVIQGTLMPGELARVKFRRNFPVNTNIDPNEILLTNATASITDGNGVEYALRLNPQTGYYEARQLNVEHGQKYTLSVEAAIDGEMLQASSTTIVPNSGLAVLEDKSVLGGRLYRERDAEGNLVNFEVVFDRSPGTDYYAASITALDADTSTYIYDNPFDNPKPIDVLDDLEDLRHTFYWIQDTPLTAGESSMEIFSFLTWFYGDYRIVLYGADQNFSDFLSTHEEVQEIDGNFHEPAFHIDGDGIGVFGSAVVDTTFFEILRP